MLQKIARKHYTVQTKEEKSTLLVTWILWNAHITTVVHLRNKNTIVHCMPRLW